MSVRRSPAAARAAAVALGASVVSVVFGAGCSGVPTPAESWQAMTNAFKLNDKRDSTEEKDEQWRVVADEGRRGQEVEYDPDRWYRKYVMSEKAREIERNFGVE